MQEIRTIEREAAEDVFFGQAVINWARWFIIAAAIVLVLWTAPDVDKLVIGIVPVVALMAVNFYLHGRQLAERPANPALITAASLLDVTVITAVILFWPDAEQRGLGSQFFIMYYPVVLAFAFVMPPRITLAYTVGALAAYAGACVLADSFASPDVASMIFATDVEAIKSLLVRLITLGAMGGLVTYYWRIQRNRRRTAMAKPVTANEPQAGLQA